MNRMIRITSYRLAYWHAPQRARHDEGDIFTCIFCQYSEGIARMRDLVAHLRQQGFAIPSHDTRSFMLGVDPTESTLDNRTSPTARLAGYVSGQSSRIAAP